MDDSKLDWVSKEGNCEQGGIWSVRGDRTKFEVFLVA